MNRRDFLKCSLYGVALAGLTTGTGLRTNRAMAATPQRSVVNIMLLGGADLRHLFVADPGTHPQYAEKFWEARQGIYNRGANYQNYNEVWRDLYLPARRNGASLGFGIHKSAAWLKTQFDAGNVAIIANVMASTNRRHDHSQLIMNTGDTNAKNFVTDRDGWGGRLANAIGAAKTVAVTRDVSVFCHGIDARNRLDRVIHAKDTRNFALPTGNDNPSSPQSALARALKSYYAGKRVTVRDKPDTWPYWKFFQHEQTLREFGDAFKNRLETVVPNQPASLTELTLHQEYFRQQCANLYDSFIGADIFKLRVASLEYSSWDTHRKQKDSFEKNTEDIFGIGKGLDTLTNELETLNGINDNIVYVFTTDFGRQLRANGDGGTDHGRGNYMILIGRDLNGGVYGEMFPQSEIEVINGETRYDQPGADIEGHTSFEHVLARVCDWVEPGTGVQVFPDTSKNNLDIYPDGPILEDGVDLTHMFKSAG